MQFHRGRPVPNKNPPSGVKYWVGDGNEWDLAAGEAVLQITTCTQTIATEYLTWEGPPDPNDGWWWQRDLQLECFGDMDGVNNFDQILPVQATCFPQLQHAADDD